jgi:hypothetical protein
LVVVEVLSVVASGRVEGCFWGYLVVTACESLNSSTHVTDLEHLSVFSVIELEDDTLVG